MSESLGIEGESIDGQKNVDDTKYPEAFLLFSHFNVFCIQ
jgi:hypothetical protein